jgi:phage baseplate assembly protein W
MINLNLTSVEGSDNAEILRNIKMLLTTPAGTVVFDREFGIDYSILDMPVDAARAKIITEYIYKIEKYEPRAKVKEISFQQNASGEFIPKVVIELV